MGRIQEVCGTPGRVFLHSCAVVHVLEGDRARVTGIVDGDVIDDVACHMDG